MVQLHGATLQQVIAQSGYMDYTRLNRGSQKGSTSEGNLPGWPGQEWHGLWHHTRAPREEPSGVPGEEAAVMG